MRRASCFILTLSALMPAICAGASDRAPASRPTATTQHAPTTQPTAPPLPTEFAVLLTRSPFRHCPAATTAPNSEASLVFKGAVEAGSEFTGFIEDMASHRVSEVRPGAPLASGRVVSIDLDSLTYETGGSTRRIAGGQNLLGQIVRAPPQTRPSSPPVRPGAPAARGPAAIALPPGVLPPGAIPAGAPPPGASIAPTGPPAGPPPDSPPDANNQQ